MMIIATTLVALLVTGALALMVLDTPTSATTAHVTRALATDEKIISDLAWSEFDTTRARWAEAANTTENAA